MASGRFVTYYRVSTDKQGKSGLGLEAQEAAVMGHLNGGTWVLVDRFVEVESGRHNDRPELAKALAACRRTKATLVIAKLDRLARNVAFVSGLMEAGVDFVAVDFPTANRLTIHILAAVAEHEAAMISARTKAALAAAKARGVVLGNPANLTAEGRARGAVAGGSAYAAKADAQATDLLPVITDINAAGTISLSGIARALNERSISTPRGGKWQPTQVRNLLARINLAAISG